MPWDDFAWLGVPWAERDKFFVKPKIFTYLSRTYVTFYYKNDQKCRTILFLVLKTGYYEGIFSILSLVSFADEINALKRYCEESLGIASFAGLKHLLVFCFLTSLLCTAIRWVKHFGQDRMRFNPILLKFLQNKKVFFTAGSWEKDTIFGASQTNIRPFLFCQDRL